MQLANARSSSDTGSNGAGETMYFKVMSQEEHKDDVFWTANW
jgi:uncharacterized protein (DUF427 family)